MWQFGFVAVIGDKFCDHLFVLWSPSHLPEELIRHALEVPGAVSSSQQSVCKRVP